MLVLSRKESDRIVFPTLGITVEVLRIQGRAARLGIEAPADVPVLRHEVARHKSFAFSTDEEAGEQLRRLVHAVRGRLEDAADVLNGLHQHLEEAGDGEALQQVSALFGRLRALDREAAAAVDSRETSAARALLVEDDANQRKLLASYLELRGITTTTANDGLDALDFLSLHAAPDVVLLDMHMPRCDGRGLVEAIRRTAGIRTLRLVALSGTDPQTLGVPTGPEGIDLWIPKPVDPERLIERIARDLGVAAVAV